MDVKTKKQPIHFNFTKTSIENLPLPDKSWRYYFDTKVAGLGIGVGPNGTKTFVLYRKVERKPERIKVGRYPDLTVDEARNQATKLNAEIATGTNPAEIKRKKRAQMTFGELFDLYYTNHSVPNKKTAKEDKAKFDTYLSSNKLGVNLAARPISTIERSDISQLFTKIGKTHKITANRVLALVSSVFGKAIEWGIWNQLNPCKGIKKHREISRDRFLQADELPKFFAAVMAHPNAIVRDFILLCLLTGARRSNVLAMRWSDLHLDRAEWRIPETKNGTPQDVPLVPAAVAILKARRESMVADGSVFVFPGTGKTGHFAEPKKGWASILKKAGIDGLRMHDLRRTMGSWQAGTGANLSIIGRSLNHKSTATTAIYARLWLQPVRDSMETATNAILAAAARKPTTETPASNSANEQDKPSKAA